jgi:glycosyltransferase involved in cell wall biosynthesis
MKIGLINSYNNEGTIEASVYSLLNQSEKIDGLVVVDDLSMDATRDILMRLARKNKKIEIEFNKTNIGAAASLNIGFGIVRNLFKRGYIFTQGGDDKSNQNRVEIQSQILGARKEISVTLGNIKSNTSANHDSIRNFLPLFAGNVKVTDLFYFGNFLCAPSASFKFDSLNKSSVFVEYLHQLHDFYLWKNLSWKNSIYYSTEEVLQYNEDGSGSSDMVKNNNSSNYNHHQHEYIWIYRSFFKNIHTTTILNQFKDTLDLNFENKFKNPKNFRNYILMKIYLSHPNRQVRELGYELYMSQLENERIKVAELNQILGLSLSDSDILDFN